MKQTSYEYQGEEKERDDDIEEQHFVPQTVFNANSPDSLFNEKLCNDDKLINAYIGKNMGNLLDDSFSWWTFFLGIIYVFYRKMWLLGLMWIGSLAIIEMIFDEMIVIVVIIKMIIRFILSIVFASKFKEQYKEHVVKKVKKIKQNNQNKTEEELLKICHRKGGISYLVVIVVIIFLIVQIGMEIYYSF